MRDLGCDELIEFDARVVTMREGLIWPVPVGYVPREAVGDESDIAYRFGIKVGDVRRLRRERRL